ncbi:hypothetical protein [Methanolobus sp.]|uniref:hypothetical protein n=1 Tax=Methanolobus sp. TaxID=1874737 RepID=UPI0025CD9B4C|nr:hypothetical protein [Methanolobus sp.]
MNPPIEPEIYNRVNTYRQQIRTSALTTFDIPRIIDTYRDLDTEKVFRHIIVGNACSWNTYEIACVHYEKYQRLFKF